MHALPSQYAPGPQSASIAHEVAHVALEPLQRYGAQLGVPGAPAGAMPQTPSALAPSAAAHTSQGAEQGALQQKPSMHWPLAHTRQPLWRQSAPAEASHAAPIAF